MTPSAFFPGGRRLLTFAAVPLVAMLLSASPAASFCTTTCTTTAGGMNCVANNAGCYLAGMSVNCATYPTMVYMSANATCSVGVSMDLMATAMHMSTAPPTATCQFRFELRCGASVACAATTTAAFIDFTCIVNQTDGLPVELMEFSVEDGDEADTEGEDASD